MPTTPTNSLIKKHCRSSQDERRVSKSLYIDYSSFNHNTRAALNWNAESCTLFSSSESTSNTPRAINYLTLPEGGNHKELYEEIVFYGVNLTLQLF